MARLSLLVAAALCSAGTAAAADTGAKKSTEQQEIQALKQQLDAVQAQMKLLAEQNQSLLQRELQLERQVTQQALAAQSSAPATTPAAPTGATPNDATSTVAAQSGGAPRGATPAGGASAGAAGAAASAFSNVHLWGYGEIYFTRPSRDTSKTQADLARAVFGIGYSFDSRTEFNSEYEVEHAVASSSDPGEFEVEQFYIDRQLNNSVTLRAGLS